MSSTSKFVLYCICSMLLVISLVLGPVLFMYHNNNKREDFCKSQGYETVSFIFKDNTETYCVGNSLPEKKLFKGRNGIFYLEK